MIWNEDCIESARQMALDGKSAAEAAQVIADSLGVLVTRSMLISLGKRRGIAFKSRNVDVHHIASLVKLAPTAPLTAAQRPQPGNIVRKSTHYEPLPVSKTIDGMLLIEIGALQNRHCRWPVDGDEVRYCGLNRPEGKAYCPAHHALAYTRRHA
jgi:hypothetical protein